VARRWLLVLALAAAVVPAVVAVAWAGEDGSAGPSPVLETEPLFDDEAGGEVDADDPAIWKHPSDPEASLVVGTAKNGGLRVFDLRGRTLQRIAAPPAPGRDDAVGRFNNVDVAYGVKIGGARLDVALVSDRGRDHVRAYAIDPKAAKAGKAPLRDVTTRHPAFVFSADQDEVKSIRRPTAWPPGTTPRAAGPTSW